MAHDVMTQAPSQTGPLTLHGHDVEGVNRCVHCGLCLSYCPTFSILGTEMDSPRGRIFLIKSLAEGRIALSDATVSHLDLCLGCRGWTALLPGQRAPALGARLRPAEAPAVASRRLGAIIARAAAGEGAGAASGAHAGRSSESR